MQNTKYIHALVSANPFTGWLPQRPQQSDCKFIIFCTQFLVFNTKFLVFKTNSSFLLTALVTIINTRLSQKSSKGKSEDLNLKV